jgi:hypothetical protein
MQIIKNIPDPENYVFSSHSYDFIELMNTFNQPVVLIRCARQDKVERCISLLISRYKNKKINPKATVWNIMRNSSDLDEYKNFVTNSEPTTFTKKEVYNHLQYHTTINRYWENNASLYQNCTVFYEDLCTDAGVDLPMLGLTSVSIATEESSTIKLPNYKKQVCLNYDMVARWVKEYCLENE